MVMQLLQKRAAGWLFKFVFVVLVGSFAFLGVQDVLFSRQQTVPAVASVGGTDITAAQLAQGFEIRFNQLNRQGGRLTKADAAKLGMVDDTLAELIDDTARDAYAARLGFLVGKQQLVDTIYEFPAFRGADGRFDRNVYAAILRQNDMTEPDFEARLAGDLRRQPFEMAGTSAGPAPEPLLDRVIGIANETRTARVLTLPDAALGDVGQPDDKTVDSLYDEEKDRLYQAPERRDLTVATFDAAAAVIATPDDKTLQEIYEESAADLTQAERRAIAFVTIADEAKAKAVYEAVKAGKSFEDATREATGNAIPPIRQVDQTADKIDPRYADQVFAADEGDLLPPVKTDYGFAIVRIDGVKAEGVMTLAEAREHLIADWRSDRMGMLVDEKRANLDDAIAAGRSLEEAAKAEGFALVTLAGIDRQGLDAAGAPVAAAKGLEDAIKAGFAEDEGRVGEITEWGEHGLLVVRTDKIIAAAPRPLAEVKARIVESWQADERRKRNAARAEGFVAALNKGEKTIDQLAAETGAAVVDGEPLTRDGAASATRPPAFIDGLFKAKAGGAFSAQTSDAMLIGVAKDIVAYDPKSDAAKRAAAAAELTQIMGREQAEQLMAGVRAATKATRNEEALTAFKATYQPLEADAGAP